MRRRRSGGGRAAWRCPLARPGRRCRPHPPPAVACMLAQRAALLQAVGARTPAATAARQSPLRSEPQQLRAAVAEAATGAAKAAEAAAAAAAAAGSELRAVALAEQEQAVRKRLRRRQAAAAGEAGAIAAAWASAAVAAPASAAAGRMGWRRLWAAALAGGAGMPEASASTL